MLYRPEIDGLLTVAIIPVILFHSGLALFSGGFIAVGCYE
jgi:peptidoglycan/LPS O-acetylase OafA/YrhL